MKFSPRRVLAILGIGTAVSLLGDSTLYTVLPDPQFALQAAVPFAQVGILLGVNRLARIFFNIPAGRLVDRFPRRPLMIGSLAIGALSTLAYAIGDGFWVMLAGRILWGAAWSGLWIGGQAIVLDLADSKNRGRLSGRYQMWFFLGIGLSALLGGIFTDLLRFEVCRKAARRPGREQWVSLARRPCLCPTHLHRALHLRRRNRGDIHPMALRVRG